VTEANFNRDPTKDARSAAVGAVATRCANAPRKTARIPIPINRGLDTQGFYDRGIIRL
jgi:hypothetical protein